MGNELTANSNQEGPARPRRGRVRGIADVTKFKGVLTEMAKVYREMRTGKTDIEKGKALIWGLDRLRAAQEASILSERLDDIERALVAQGAGAKVIDGNFCTTGFTTQARQ